MAMFEMELFRGAHNLWDGSPQYSTLSRHGPPAARGHPVACIAHPLQGVTLLHACMPHPHLMLLRPCG